MVPAKAKAVTETDKINRVKKLKGIPHNKAIPKPPPISKIVAMVKKIFDQLFWIGLFCFKAYFIYLKSSILKFLSPSWISFFRSRQASYPRLANYLAFNKLDMSAGFANHPNLILAKVSMP